MRSATCSNKQSVRWCAGLAAALLPVVLGGGCESMSNTDKGLLTGGALGAAAGGLIGGARGKAGIGALAGGVLGAAAGGLTGAAIDHSEKKQEAAAAAAYVAQHPAPTLQEVVQLTANGTSDVVIINQIRNSGAVYNLTSDDIVYLKQNGVHDPVITEMQATAIRAPGRVYTAVPVEPVYVYPSPPPVAVGVGFSYGRRW
jgi:surface antigen